MAILRTEFVARLLFRADFVTGLFVAIFQHMVTLSLLWLIFLQVPQLGGWNGYQAAVLYALFSLALAFPNLVAGGLRRLPDLIRTGDLDGLLVQPVSLYLQLLPQFNMGALGDIIVSVAVLVVASGPAGVVWSLSAVLVALFGILCGAGIFLGFLTLLYSIGFWVPYANLMGSMEEVAQFARYPARIFPRWVQVVITWVLPVTFASYYPAAIITRAEETAAWMGLVALPAAAVMLLLGMLVWRQGLLRYESSGN